MPAPVHCISKTWLQILFSYLLRRGGSSRAQPSRELARERLSEIRIRIVLVPHHIRDLFRENIGEFGDIGATHRLKEGREREVGQRGVRAVLLFRRSDVAAAMNAARFSAAPAPSATARTTTLVPSGGHGHPGADLACDRHARDDKGDETRARRCNRIIC